MAFPDSTLLIGVLIVAMIPVYILILKKLKPKTIHPSKPTVNDSKPVTNMPKKSEPKIKKRIMIPKEETPETAESGKSGNMCFHSFGYLRTLPKNASIPDECLGCPKIVACLMHTQISESMSD